MNCRKLSTLSVILIITCLSTGAQEKTKKFSAFRDSLDNAIDISDWLVNKKGILIVPTIITEPAVDYGAAIGALFFHSAYTEKKGPPSISGVGGGATLNGTWAAAVFHLGFWKSDQIRYLGALGKTNANLGFYGSGSLGIPGVESVNLNLDAWFLIQQLKFRLGSSDFFLGGNYMLLDTYNTFEIPIDIPEFTGISDTSTLREVSLKFEFDSRNNIFTPTKGLFLGLSGDALYGRIGLTLIGYIPAGDKVFVGIRHESNYSLGDIPFYARPIINMRGAPLMKYQNKNTLLMEAELSWNVYKRWFVSGFAGIGNAFESFENFDGGKSVATVGTGFRYKLARKLGTNMGMDFGFSQDDFAFYIVLGTAWLR